MVGFRCIFRHVQELPGRVMTAVWWKRPPEQLSPADSRLRVVASGGVSRCWNVGRVRHHLVDWAPVQGLDIQTWNDVECA